MALPVARVADKAWECPTATQVPSPSCGQLLPSLTEPGPRQPMLPPEVTGYVVLP